MIAEIVVIALERDIADRPRASEGNLGSHPAGTILAFVGVDLASVERIPNLKVASVNREGNDPSIFARRRSVWHAYSPSFLCRDRALNGNLDNADGTPPRRRRRLDLDDRVNLAVADCLIRIDSRTRID